MSRICEIEGATKFLISSNYTWAILDVDKPISVIEDSKALAWDNANDKIGMGWTSYIKKSQQRFVDDASMSMQTDSDTTGLGNLIVNKNKNAMLDASVDEKGNVTVIENLWHASVKKFVGAAVLKAKFGKS